MLYVTAAMLTNTIRAEALRLLMLLALWLLLSWQCVIICQRRS